MYKKTYQILWIISLLIIASLACGLVNQVNQVKENVQSAATQIEGIVTQAPGLIATGKAIATENPGLVQTGQALITTSGPGLIETVQAFATDQPGLMETIQALATDNPEIANTALALATKVSQGGTPSPIPTDIPLPQQDRLEQLNGTSNMVVYFTSIKYKNIVTFYKTEMVNNEWEAVADGTVETSKTTVLNFKKDNRTASVLITLNSGDNMTGVVITIQAK